MGDTAVCFIDNSTAEHVLQRGWARDAFLNNVVCSFGCWVSERGIRVIFHRVPSKANLADGPSRNDFSSVRALGLNIVNPDFSRRGA